MILSVTLNALNVLKAGHYYCKHFNPFPHRDTLILTPLGNKPFENTVGKGEIARYEQFLFSHSVFYLFG